MEKAEMPGTRTPYRESVMKGAFLKSPFCGRNQLSLNCCLHCGFSWGLGRGVD